MQSLPYLSWVRVLAVAAAGLALAALFAYSALFPRLSWWVDDALQRRLAAALPLDGVVVVDVDDPVERQRGGEAPLQPVIDPP